MANTYTALFWAYTAFWGLIFIYLLVVSKEQNKLKNKIEKLEQGLK